MNPLKKYQSVKPSKKPFKSLSWLVLLFISLHTHAQESPVFIYSNAEGKQPVTEYKGYHYVAFPLEYQMTSYITLKNETIQQVEVYPRSKALDFEQLGNTIAVKLYEHGHYMVKLNGKHKFFIFAEEVRKAPEKEKLNVLDLGIDNSGQSNMTSQLQSALNQASETGKMLYFPAGIYKTYPLEIKSNTHIYLEKDAVIKADDSDIKAYRSKDDLTTKRFIYIKDAQNVHIEGQGEIDGNGKALRDKYGDEARMRLLMVFRSKNIQAEGLMFKDPGSWNTQILCSEDIILRNIKLMNDIELSNTDGFDPDASKRVLIENCFAYCSDDNVAIKITNISGYKQDVEDITVRGCFFLTKKSSLKVGTETRGNYIRNILFEDNDVIESDRGMALYVRDGAVLENIRYINNRFEYNYPDAKRCGIHFSVDKRKDNSKLGMIKDVLVKDCTFQTPFPKPSEIKSEAENGINAEIENLNIAGKQCKTLEEAGIKAKNAHITIK